MRTHLYIFLLALCCVAVLSWLYVTSVVQHTKQQLSEHQWQWIETRYAGGETILPQRQGVFKLIFGQNGELSITTDCNSQSGTYTARAGVLTISELASTLMYCEGSQESVFSEMMHSVSTYEVDGDALLLGLKNEEGVMYFRALEYDSVEQ